MPGRRGWIAGAVIMGVCVTGLGCSGEDSRPRPPPAKQIPGPVALDRVTTRSVDVGEGPYDVVAAFGSIWIARTDGVASFDPESGSPRSHVAIANAGEWTNLAAGGTALWYLESPGALVEVGPIGGTVTAETHFGADDGTDSFEGVGATAGGVCAGQLAPVDAPGLVCVRADSSTSFTVEVPHEDLGVSVVAGTRDGSIWAAGSGLVRVDLMSQKATTVVGPTGRVSALAADGSAVWAAALSEAGTELWHVSGTTAERRARFPGVFVSALAFGGGRLWVLANGAVSYLSADDMLVRVAKVPKGSRSLAATATSVWTVEYRTRTATIVSGVGSR